MKKMMPIFLSLFFAAAAIFAAVISANADDTLKYVSGTVGLQITDTAIEGTDYVYANNVLTIMSSTELTISGTTATDRIVVDSPDGANITLSGIAVTSADFAAFEIAESTRGLVTVTLSGSNQLTSGGECAGLQKNGDTCALLIEGDGGLVATAGDGGAGIGGAAGKSSGNIEIKHFNNGSSANEKIKLITGGKGGAGVGGGKDGNGTDITISGGYIQVGDDGYLNKSRGGAGIGGGENGSGSRITIAGGFLDIDTQGGGAGIGGGDGGEGSDITISGGDCRQVISSTGAGIGGGNGAEGHDITISGGKYVNIVSQNGGAGIGGGAGADGYDITISSENVKADSTQNGAAIGGGEDGDGYRITIEGNAVVTACGRYGGAGIGGGYGGDGYDIMIKDNASVTARIGEGNSGGYGAAIGGGAKNTTTGKGGNGHRITIKGCKKVEATTMPGNVGGPGAGIGGGQDGNGTDITISGGTDITATGGNGSAGIGGGANGDGKRISISNAKVTAIGNQSGAGIGGGALGNAEDIKIYGTADVTASGNGSAGIGGGQGSNTSGGNAKNIEIYGSAKVTATGYNGAGIGGGNNGNAEDIKIYDNADVTATGYGGAGIGGGMGGARGGACNNIEIYGSAKVTANGNGGAGIGGGLGGANPSNGEVIKIYGSADVTATSNGSAGIGGGSGGNGTDITISGGTVKATGNGGAGIGGGSKTNQGGGTGERITISDDAYVEAKSLSTGAGIGGGNGGAGIDITISGNANVKEADGGSSGAGIGGGASGSGSNIEISGDAKINATAQNGAGIGGGAGGSGSNIEISGDATINATALNGAGIGGGASGSSSNITISGNVDVTATSTSGGAGIGGGGGGSADNINININDEVGNKIVAKSTGSGAGIGGGSGGVGMYITISGGVIEATGGSGGAGIGGGAGKESTNITISGGEVTATGGNYAAGIGGGSGGSGSKIHIYDANVKATCSGAGSGIGGGSSGSGSEIYIYTDKGETTVIAKSVSVYPGGVSEGSGIGGGAGGSGSDIKISGNATVVADGGYGAGIGCGITGTGSDITISDNAYVTANSVGGAALGSGKNGTSDYVITIEGGTVVAVSENSVGIGNADSTAAVKIAGKDSKNYPWVFTNNIQSDSYDNTTKEDSGYWGIVFEWDGDTFTDIEDNNFNEGIVYGTNHDVKLTGDYTLTTGKKLTVMTGATFITDNKLTLDGSVLYLKEGAVLDKWYETEKINGGEIQHEDHSDYQWYDSEEHTFINSTNYTLYKLDGKEGIVLCDICGEPEPHNPNINDGWETTETHHWHEGICDLEDDCAVAPFKSAVTECSYMADGKLDYGEHSYGDPVKEDDGKLHFYCIDCRYEKTMEIPIAYLIKVDGTTDEPLAGAEFGLYSDAQCTVQVETAASEIDAEGKAVVSFEAMPNTTYYIKETKAPDGYRASNTVFKVVVDADGKVTYGDVGSEITSEEVPVCKNFVEAVASDPAKLIKTDGEGAPLTGAVFGLYSDEACTALITTAATSIDTDAASDTYNKAVVFFDTEPDTTYYIKETKAPSGYKASGKVFKAIVGADGKVTYGVVSSASTSDNIPVCENDKIIADPAKLIKTDGEGTPLTGAEFGIYSDEACTVLIATATTAIDTDAASDTYNKAIVSFATEPDTTYYIKETKAPSGYAASDKVFKAIVDADGKVTYGVVGSADASAVIPVCENVADEVITAAPAKLIKVDGEGEPLAGAEFGIYSDEACTVLIATATTAIDTNAASDTYNKAIVSFATELNTTYYIKEIKAPSGYKKSGEVYVAIVGADGKVTYGVVSSEETSADIPVCENKKLPADANKNPETGVGVSAAGIAGVALLIDIIHAASVKKGTQKRKKKNGEDK